MEKIVDARGLSCPQPVLMILDAIKGMDEGEVVIRVDTDTSKENVTRAAASKGWRVSDVQADGSGYQITIAK